MRNYFYFVLAFINLPFLCNAQILQIEKNNAEDVLLQTKDIKEMRFKTSQSEFEDNTPDYVEIIDLGLSVNWASVNLGAALPEEPGYLITWGELEEKDWYSWSYYKFGDSKSTLTKYTVTDGLNTLQSEDDAATMLWGGDWHIPSRENWQELVDNCDIDYAATQNGYPGVRITSRVPGYEGNSIFLCAAGWIQDEYHLNESTLASYWTNECVVFPGEISLPEFAFAAEFWRSGDYANSYYYSGVYRWQGRPIRAVIDKNSSETTDSKTTLVIELNDGTTQNYLSDDMPKVSFEEEYICVKSDLIETRFEINNVARFYFEINTDDIDKVNEQEFSFYYDGNNVIVNGKACTICIYDINGTLYYNGQTKDGYNSIDISNYNPGLYIVKANNQSIKIIKK